ncbi:MAG: hypothetical protein HYU42_16430 [Candidatus Rokubacteria bacterium]|nr:hypothetical protein [Candidatus Rokubacteria bacterium]MBI2200160.1 hypothetical protein [Candidatus Rokubacteria bacterium]
MRISPMRRHRAALRAPRAHGGDVRDALVGLGNEVRTFAHRRDNPLWMIPFECIAADAVFFTKERYALRALEAVGLENLHSLLRDRLLGRPASESGR